MQSLRKGGVCEVPVPFFTGGRWSAIGWSAGAQAMHGPETDLWLEKMFAARSVVLVAGAVLIGSAISLHFSQSRRSARFPPSLRHWQSYWQSPVSAHCS